MKNSNSFQTGALIFFGAGIIIAVVIFAVTKATVGTSRPTLILWGTETSDAMLPLLQSYENSDSPFRVKYVEKNEENFDADFIAALAAGTGPDAVIIPDRLFLERKNLYYTIPYASYPQRTFVDAFAPESQALLSPDGVEAIPLLIDPLVMYWNRDTFAKAGTLVPPKTWDELTALAPKVSVFDKTLRLSQSMIAFGDAQNVPHFKELLLTLWLQDACNNPGKTCAVDTTDQTASSLTNSIQFFTGFVNPSKTAYSWNHAEQNAKDAFLGGTLATYFGYGSELTDIQKKNANLNFDMAYLPQPANAAKPVTYGSMQLFAIVKNSKNLASAFALGVGFASHDSDQALSTATGIPPMRSDLLSAPPEDSFSPIVFGSVLRAQGWLDPNPLESSLVLSRLVGDVVSGATPPDQASARAMAELSDLQAKDPQ